MAGESPISENVGEGARTSSAESSVVVGSIIGLRVVGVVALSFLGHEARCAESKKRKRERFQDAWCELPGKV